MKVEVTEFNQHFYINMTAESMDELAKMTRIGINKTKQVSANVSVSRDGRGSLSLYVGKNKNETGTVGKGKWQYWE